MKGRATMEALRKVGGIRVNERTKNGLRTQSKSFDNIRACANTRVKKHGELPTLLGRFDPFIGTDLMQSIQSWYRSIYLPAT